MSESRVIARNAIARAVGEVGSKLASLAFYVVMARQLGDAGFGDFMFALSLGTVLVVASGFGFDELVTREVARDREAAHRYLSDTVAVRVLLCLPILALGVGIVALGGHGGDVVVTFLLVGAGLAIENIGHSWTSILQAYERQELVALGLIVQRAVTALAGIAVLLAGGGVVLAAAIYLAGAVIGIATVVATMHRLVLRPHLAVDSRHWRALVLDAFPIGLNTLMFTLLLKLDQALIGFLAGDGNAAVGIYASAMRLVEATMFIPWAFQAAMLPWLSRQQMGGDAIARGYEVSLKALTVILLPIGLGFVLLADPVIHLLYGDEFAAAVLPLQLLGLTTVLYGMNAFASSAMVAQDRPKQFTGVLAVVTVLNVALNVALIPPYGADGAAAAALASGVVFALLSLWQVRSVVGAIRLGRTFAGPFAAGVALTAVALAVPGPAVAGVAAGAVAFLAVLLVWERTWSPEDVTLGRALLRRRQAEGTA